MLLVYTADLHGNIMAYRQLLELAVTQQAAAVVVGGDLLPQHIKLSEGIQAQRRFIQTQLRPLLSEFRSAYPQIDVFLLPGNDDWAAAIADLDTLADDGLVYPLHQRVYPLRDNLWLAGYACVPITPFSVKDYERHDGGSPQAYSFAMAYISRDGLPVKTTLADLLRLPSIAQDLADLAGQSDPARTIYVCHTPPYDTGLDQMRHKHVGSRALRAFIEQYQPLLTLHGHIHEAPQLSGRYAEQLGHTWCVNPGHSQQHFHAVVVDTACVAAMWHTVFGPVLAAR